MYDHVIGTLVADRHRAFMQQANDNRLIGTVGPVSQVPQAGRLALSIWVAAQPGTFRLRPEQRGAVTDRGRILTVG